MIVLGQRVGDIMMIRIPNSEHALEIHPDKKIVFKTPPNNPKPTKFVLRRSDVINIIDLAKTSWIKHYAPMISRVSFYPSDEQAKTTIKTIGILLDEWKKKVVLQGLRKKTAARTIQRAYREARNNPAHDMCKKRLMGEFEELKSNFKK